MSWLTIGLSIWLAGASGLAAMRAALERGDVDEAARQGASAGPAVVERALAARDRTTQLAALAAAPLVEDRGELLLPLAALAAGPDRRTAIPAADAARTIARELARRAAAGQRSDELADADLASVRAAWAQLALRGDRWIELRLRALDTAAALDPGGTGVDLALALGDPDPAFRRAAATIVALPAPPSAFAALAAAVVHDADPDVALGAAQSLCLSFEPGDPATTQPVLAALGAPGLARLRAVVPSHRPDVAAARDAARCLTADGAPESLAAAKAIPPAPRAPTPAVPRAPRTHRDAAR
jgi:hypothetical protein